MTISTRRIAAAAAAALMPLAALSIATAAPSVAEKQCAAGQSEFNGNCVDNCKKSEVRKSDSGQCQSLLRAALDKAETPAVAKLTPEQMGGAWQMAQNARLLPEANRSVGMAMDVVDTAVDIPVSVAAAAADTTDALAFLAILAQGGNPIGLGARSTGGQLFSAAAGAPAAASGLADVAKVATSLPTPQLPKAGLPQLPKLGAPQLPKAGLPKPGLPEFGLPKLPKPGLPEFGLPKLPPPPPIGMPKIGAPKLPSPPKIGLPKIGPPKLFGICGPKMLFFKPCI